MSLMDFMDLKIKTSTCSTPTKVFIEDVIPEIIRLKRPTGIMVIGAENATYQLSKHRIISRLVETMSSYGHCAVVHTPVVDDVEATKIEKTLRSLGESGYVSGGPLVPKLSSLILDLHASVARSPRARTAAVEYLREIGFETIVMIVVFGDTSLDDRYHRYHHLQRANFNLALELRPPQLEPGIDILITHEYPRNTEDIFD